MQQQTLTNREMKVMTVLWAMQRGASVNDILERYPEPKPAYTTIATFLKVLTHKGFVEHKNGQGKQYVYTPLVTKEKYLREIDD